MKLEDARWYRDVMDVELRQRLKALGFKRKSYQTYVRESGKNRWIFELHHHPKHSFVDFTDLAGVFNYEIDRLGERLNLNWAHSFAHAGTRTPAHATTSITQQVAIERRWDTVAWEEDHPPNRTWFGNEIRSRPPSVEQALRFRSNRGMWIANPDRRLDPSEWSRQYDQVVTELGGYLAELFDRHILPWYEKSEDPRWFAEWCALRLRPARPSKIVAIVAVLLTGDREWAENFTRATLAQWERPYEALLAEAEDRILYKGWRRWLHGRYQTDTSDTPAEEARRHKEACATAAADARALAAEFGLSL